MSTKMLYRGAEVDVGNPRRPLSEQSATLLYRSLKDVEAAMNDEELTMVHMCQQIPRKSMEERLSKGWLRNCWCGRKWI